MAKIPARDVKGQIIQHPGLARVEKEIQAEKASTLPKGSA
jgi:hypothetical protein